MPRLSAVGVLLLVLLGIGSAATASAHPIDELLQQIYLTPEADGVKVELELTPGPLVAGAFTALVDTDGDRRISDTEATSHAHRVLQSVRVTVDGSPVALVAGVARYPDAEVMAAGSSVAKVAATARFETGGRHVVTITDDYQPLRTSVQASVTPTASAPVVDVAITHADSGRTMTVAYAGAPGAAPRGGDDADRSSRDSGPFLLAALQEPVDSPLALAALLLASAALGALHALTPGHGKTLLAAYLVGDQGTPRQAITLAGGVTVTHTASVIGVGLVVLAAGPHVVPAALAPSLELAAGAVVGLLGTRLLLRRWRDRQHVHHEHPHPHPHPADAVDGGPHSPRRSPIAMLTMSVSNGIVPCPEALGVLLLAVAVHRTALGVGMIVAFSAGLAAVLVALGLLLVTPRTSAWLRRRGDRHGWSRWIPLASAVVVTCLGVGLVLRGVNVLVFG